MQQASSVEKCTSCNEAQAFRLTAFKMYEPGRFSDGW